MSDEAKILAVVLVIIAAVLLFSQPKVTLTVNYPDRTEITNAD